MTTIFSGSSSKYGKYKKLFLVFVVVLLFLSLFVVYSFMVSDDVGVGGVWDAVLDGAVFVGSEGELEAAVADAVFGVSSVIVLNRDVTLNGSLVISEGKNVTLTSRDRFGGGFFRLVGATGQCGGC